MALLIRVQKSSLRTQVTQILCPGYTVPLPKSQNRSNTSKAVARALQQSNRSFRPSNWQHSRLDRGRTPIEILAHIRACADLWSYSIYAILSTKDEPVLAQINAHKWAAILDYAKCPFDQSFTSFKATRADLPHASANGSTQPTAKRIAMHELSHCKELESIANLLTTKKNG